MSVLTITHEVSKDELLQLIAQSEFSAPEKRKILEELFPQRGVSDNGRLIANISEFLCYNA